MPTSNDKHPFQTLLPLFVGQAAFTLIVLLMDRSEPERAVLGGYSAAKLGLIIIAASILLILAGLWALRHFQSVKYDQLLAAVKTCATSRSGSLGLFLFGFIWLLLVVILFFIQYQAARQADIDPLVLTAFENAAPLIISIAGFTVAFYILAGTQWHMRLFPLGFSQQLNAALQSSLFMWIWMILVLFLTLVEALYLILKWDLRTIIPNWYWQLTTKPDFRYWLILPLGVIFFGGYWLITRKVKSGGLAFILIFLIGFSLIIGFAALEGDPVQILYDKRLISGHRDYVALAARGTGGTSFLFDYAAALGHNRFLATKPPGVYLLYRGMLGLGSVCLPAGTYERNYAIISWVSMLLFPILSLTSGLFLSRLTERISRIKPPVLPAFLWMMTPSFLLMTGTIDQAVIPLFLVVILVMAIKSFTENGAVLAALTGIAIYFGFYFSFSLLPVVIVFGVWLLLELARERHRSFTRRALKLSLLMVAGFSLMTLLGYLVFGYLPWERYLAAMAVHTVQRPAPVGWVAWLKVLMLNNIEFFGWSGFPLMVTALLAGGVSLVRLCLRQWSSLDSLTTALWAGFLFVNLFGNTIGEVGRLWIFFLPLMSMVAIDFIQIKMNRAGKVVYLLALQFATVVLVSQHVRITWQ